MNENENNIVHISVDAPRFRLDWRIIKELNNLAETLFKDFVGKRVTVCDKIFPMHWYEGEIGLDSEGYFVKSDKEGKKYSIAWNLSGYEYFITK